MIRLKDRGLHLWLNPLDNYIVGTQWIGCFLSKDVRYISYLLSLHAHVDEESHWPFSTHPLIPLCPMLVTTWLPGG